MNVYFFRNFRKFVYFGNDSFNIFEFMLPDSEDFPIQGNQFVINRNISEYIITKLLLPKFFTGCRSGIVQRTSVPETSVHKYRKS